MTDGLFDVPDDAYLIPPAPPELTRAERRKRLVASRIATGWHPLGYTRIHADPTLTCGTCRFRVLVGGNNKSYPKCHLPDVNGHHPRDTGCESSDIRKWWPACIAYESQEVTNDGCVGGV